MPKPSKDVWTASATQVLAIGTDPAINQAVAYQCNGSSWQRTTLSGAGQMKSLWGSSFSIVIAGGRFAPWQRFDGTSWSNATTAAPTESNALWGTSANNVVLVGSGGYAARYTGTTELTPITTGTTNALVSV